MQVTTKTARWIGVFYLLATLAGITGLGISDPILSETDYLTEIATHETQIKLGALLELVMAVSVVGISLAAYPVLRKYRPSFAVGYFAARLVEAVIFIIDVVALLLLFTLSQELEKVSGAEPAYFHTVGELLLAVRDWSGHVVLDVAVFPLGALLLYMFFYQSQLIPRWISGWGLIGAVLYWAASVLVLFDVIEPLKSIHIMLQAPIGIQEIVMALWLVIKGFDATALKEGEATA